MKERASDGTKFPYLVQRVDMRRSPRDRKGVDAYFTFDYMGSSEFEWGALPKALKEIRAADWQSWEPKKITVDGKMVWFLGDPKLYQSAVEFFEDQLKDFNGREIELKERSNIRNTFDPAEKFDSFQHAGWWALDASPPWVMFVKKEHAKLWKACLDKK